MSTLILRDENLNVIEIFFIRIIRPSKSGLVFPAPDGFNSNNAIFNKLFFDGSLSLLSYRKLYKNIKDINIIELNQDNTVDFLNDKFKVRDFLKNIVTIPEGAKMRGKIITYENIYVKFSGSKFVIQAPTGAGGENTYLVENEEDIQKWNLEKKLTDHKFKYYGSIDYLYKSNGDIIFMEINSRFQSSSFLINIFINCKIDDNFDNINEDFKVLNGYFEDNEESVYRKICKRSIINEDNFERIQSMQWKLKFLNYTNKHLKVFGNDYIGCSNEKEENQFIEQFNSVNLFELKIDTLFKMLQKSLIKAVLPVEEEIENLEFKSTEIYSNSNFSPNQRKVIVDIYAEDEKQGKYYIIE
ncbi:hypothetical protein H8356DRAFT_1436415, partial [Neocallimastix lanati (nom. inval.)]